MTDIGFYHLTKSPLDDALPRLLEKIVSGGKRAVVLAPNAQEVERLNRHLWLYSQQSFLPHGSVSDGDAGLQPIWLTDREENPNGAEVLAVTWGMEPGFYADFTRVVDMFDGGDASAVAAARARWKRYKDAGHGLTYWKQNEKGGWEKGA